MKMKIVIINAFIHVDEGFLTEALNILSDKNSLKTPI